MLELLAMAALMQVEVGVTALWLWLPLRFYKKKRDTVGREENEVG